MAPNAKPSRVTLMDVARKAGLSKAATCYALKDAPNISPATKTRVKAIAQKLGYRPDPLLSRLMTHLHEAKAHRYLGKIAFLNVDRRRDFTEVTPALASFFRDATSRATVLGYETEEFWMHEPDRKPYRLGNMLFARGIDGIIVGGMHASGALPEFPWERFAAVSIGYSITAPMLPRVVPHHYRNTLLALEKAWASGYRRPGLLTYYPQEHAMMDLHVAAFLAKQRTLPPSSRVAVMDSPATTADAIGDWFRKERPDVILTTNYPAQIYMAEAGIRIPQDVALVSLIRGDDENGIAGVKPGFERLGAVAVDQLVSLLHHGKRGIPKDCTTVEMEGQWIPGASMPVLA